MIRVVLVTLAMLTAMAQLVVAEETRFSGKYQVAKPRHIGKVNKVEALTVKQKVAPSYNPKELKVDEKAQWKKAPTDNKFEAPKKQP